eukprot:TRINITY_DN5442_c0_g1_i1.p1 TRINITY_DN5442_c0_g1~~TRINITY_DN5442_c0_g1_i1.p1  ORF type:complete len:414 (+),score=88.40 TRINITY_DN5442_c0_g1_i1:87-1328(+)
MSREAKKRILAAAAEFERQQNPSSPPQEDVVAARGNDLLWPACSRLQAEAKDLEVDLQAIFVAPPSSAPDDTTASQPGKSKYKWSTSLDNQFKFNAKTAYMRSDIYNIDWHEGLLGVERSAAGAEGVFFVQTTTGALVVKGSRNLAAECFASMLALRVGVYCPPWRIIPMANAEGQSMLYYLGELDAMGRVATNIGSQTHVVLKAFVAGRNLDAHTAEDMQTIFGKSHAETEAQKRRINELARLLLLDVLLNNGDRLPLIHDNRGNPGNVMLCRGSGQVVAIDSAMAAINKRDYPEQYQAYLDKVGSLVDSLLETRDSEGKTTAVLPAFATVQDKLREYTGYQMSDIMVRQLQDAFLTAATSLHADSVLKRMELKAWRQLLGQVEPALVGMDWISVDFVMDVWQVFAQRLDRL